MFLPNEYEFSCFVKINSGTRALEHLPHELDALNARKPLIVAGKDVSKEGHVRKLMSAFRDSGMTIGVCDDISGPFDAPLIEALTNLYRNKDHDSIVAVGSGSIVDVAKVLNVSVSYGGRALRELAGNNGIPNPLDPFIFVPTAGGDGYETSRYAEIEDMKFSSDFLMPDLVVIDPRMVTSRDTRIIVATAMTALSHAVEAYTSPAKNHITDIYAHAAIKYVAEYLIPVVRHPADRDGSCALANAACMAGCVVSDMTMGMAHILGETIGAMFGITPGICMGIVLPYTVAHRALHFGARTADLILPLAGFDDCAKISPSLSDAVAVTMMIDLQHELNGQTHGGIPRTLEEADVPLYMLQDIAERCITDDLPGYTYSDYLTVVKQAWEGSPAMNG